MKLCFATNNEHKLAEIKAILGSSFQIVSLNEIGCDEELAEEKNTLEGNSLQKAEYVFKKYNVPCFADDTGLEVDVLNGAPGVFSARYAGSQRSSEDNISLLLRNLNTIENRRAQFKTVITFIDAGRVKQFEGIVAGTIIKERRGTVGFGYDPVFVPDGFTQTMAEMSSGEKNKISHRAKAMTKLMTFLKKNN